MLTRFDELTCHQTVSSFDHPETSDKAWTEKLWFNIHDKSGKFVLATGFGVYPNRNVMDAYGCLNLENSRQVNVRLSRELRPKIDEVAVGPLSLSVIEPFRRIRVAMGENAQKLSYDLEFLGDFQPSEEEPHFERQHGRTVVNACRYAQMGRAKGFVKLDGVTYKIDEKDFIANRDHSWGIRMGVGAPEEGVQAPDTAPYVGMMIDWFTFQFDDFGIAGYLIEKDDGTITRLTGHIVPRMDSDKKQVPIVGMEHDWKFHERSLRTSGGKFTVIGMDKSRYEMELRELTTMYLRGGGYVGYKDFRHGKWMGPSWTDGESWNVADPKVANEVHGLDDTVMEIKCNGKVGYGIMENMVIPSAPPFGGRYKDQISSFVAHMMAGRR